VQLDLDAVRKMPRGLIDHHMAARHQKQTSVTLKEEAAGVG
jgi:hypothetical protein